MVAVDDGESAPIEHVVILPGAVAIVTRLAAARWAGRQLRLYTRPGGVEAHAGDHHRLPRSDRVSMYFDRHVSHLHIIVRRGIEEDSLVIEGARIP